MHRILVVTALCVIAGNAGASGCRIPLQPTKTSFVTVVWIGFEGPLRFLVDTGTTTTVIDRPVAERVGLHPTRTIAAVSATGTINVEESVVEELRAGDVTVSRTPVLIVDLPRFSSHGHLDGILGMSAFARRAMMLDLRRRCLDVDVESPRGMVLEAHEIAGRVAIEVEGLKFILDSGASFPVLKSPRARGLAAVGGTAEITTAAGRQRLTTATIPRLRIGERTFRDVAAAVAPATNPREDGLFPLVAFATVYFSADRKSVVIR